MSTKRPKASEGSCDPLLLFVASVDKVVSNSIILNIVASSFCCVVLDSTPLLQVQPCPTPFVVVCFLPCCPENKICCAKQSYSNRTPFSSVVGVKRTPLVPLCCAQQVTKEYLWTGKMGNLTSNFTQSVKLQAQNSVFLIF